MKVAVVTGASRGLGRATARLFVEEGWDVAAAARDAAALSELAREVEGAPGALLPLAIDVADAAAVDGMVARTVERFGRLDVLVNNAATDHPASVEDLTHEQWRRVVAVNLNGPFYAAKAAFPVMRRQGGGLIINVSSVAGRKGWANATAYCATKFALTGFTQALNAEGAPFGIRCAVVYPGGMDTSWHREGHPEFLEPETVARFLLHMAGQDPRLVINEAVVTPVGEAGYP